MGIRIVLPLFVFSVLLLVPVGAQNAFAIPTPVTFDDGVDCDPLMVPPLVDELGFDISPPPSAFPLGERLRTADFQDPAQNPPCPSTDITVTPDLMVSITNDNSIAFTDVWYVADPDTSLTNVDGVIVGPGGAGNAFKIDADYCLGSGINTPLVFESMTADCIFEPGEFWDFTIQDYFNSAGKTPAAIYSVGVISPAGSPDTSSGSIIATPDITLIGGEFIPIDSTALLLAGAQSTASWMIPVLISAVGIGLVLVRKK